MEFMENIHYNLPSRVAVSRREFGLNTKLGREQGLPVGNTSPRMKTIRNFRNEFTFAKTSGTVIRNMQKNNWPIADRRVPLTIPETIAGHTSSFIVSRVANGNNNTVLFGPPFQLQMLPCRTVSITHLAVHFQYYSNIRFKVKAG